VFLRRALPAAKQIFRRLQLLTHEINPVRTTAEAAAGVCRRSSDRSSGLRAVDEALDMEA